MKQLKQTDSTFDVDGLLHSHLRVRGKGGREEKEGYLRQRSVVSTEKLSQLDFFPFLPLCKQVLEFP